MTIFSLNGCVFDKLCVMLYYLYYTNLHSMLNYQLHHFKLKYIRNNIHTYVYWHFFLFLLQISGGPLQTKIHIAGFNMPRLRSLSASANHSDHDHTSHTHDLHVHAYGEIGPGTCTRIGPHVAHYVSGGEDLGYVSICHYLCFVIIISQTLLGFQNSFLF